MRIRICLLSVMVGLKVCAATYEWQDVSILNGGVWGTPIHSYDLFGSVVGAGSGSTEGPLLGFANEDGFHLKQRDHKSTPMPMDNNVWVLSYYGDLLNAETIERAKQVPLVIWSDESTVGGLLIEDPSDFYLGFMSTGENAYDGVDRFGWYHVSLDDKLEMTMLDAGIGFCGEDIIVGVGPTPEPTSGLLLLVGVVLLGLRRGAGRPHGK